MIRLINKNWLSAFVGACIMLALAVDIQAQTLNTLWERTSRTGAAEVLPSWFTVGSVRGMAYGTVDGNARVYAADRANSTIQVMDATTGADVTLGTAFDLSGVSGGTLPMNDIEVSDDGVIFLGNLASSTLPFRLYWWTQEGGAYADSVTIPVAGRVGDKFTVVGSLADNTIEVWMATASTDPGIVYVATTADQGANWNVETITLSGTNTVIGSSADVAPLALGRTSDFYVGGNSSAPARYSSAGAYVASSAFASASRNGMEVFTYDGKDHLAVYSYRPDGASSGNKTGQVYIYDISDATAPTIVSESPLMGDDADSFSSIHGEAEISLNSDGTFNVYALEGVNGLASFTNAEPPLVDDPSNLIFSEYIEGSSNNKALEISNLSDSTVFLANYRIAQSANGGGWQFFHEFKADASIAPGEQYVVMTDQVDPTLFAAEDADEVLGFPSPVHHNGDDARGIIHIDSQSGDTTWIDVFGKADEDPGSGWDVAGVTTGTKEHTLLRKSTVVSGNAVALASFGTNADDSEWIVKDQNDFSNLGKPTGAGEPVTVTFRVNTSTVPDTLMENGFVQIRGSFIASLDSAAYGGQNVTWDGASTPVATNVGGDYWNIDVQMAPGDSLVYKYWVGLDGSTGANDNGWESNGPFNGNYLYVLPDTSENVTLDLDYFNNSGDGRGAPFTSESDSISVYFRVNVGAQAQDGSFDPETFKVGVRGAGSFFTNDWGTGDFLEKGGSKGDNLFYEGVVRVQKDSAATITGPIGYKFVLEDAAGTVTWESFADNRTFNVPSADSTIRWEFFNNTKPTDAVIVNTALSFEVNVGILEGLNLFNSSIDTVSVRGTFNSWGEQRMNFNQVLGTYEANNIAYTKAEGTVEKYKYYIKWDSRRDSAESEFFLDGIESANTGWEEPGVTGGADRTFTIENKTSQDKLSEFYNGVEPEALLTANNVEGGAISVTFSVDMSPALQHTTPFVPASDSVFLFVDTPFFALTNGITVPGDNGQNFITQSQAEIDRLMFTDDDGDMVYELTLDLVLPTLNHIGFRIAYGEPTSADGSLVVNGGGFDAGRRHYQYISPQVDAEGNVTWASTFAFPQLTWKASDLPWETPPDYQTVSNEEIVGNVETFRLDQNYPNPFNPSTTISFNLPNAADVTLSVYNVLGQRVATLLNNRKYTSGSHTLSFDASNLASGIYIYRLEAGSFTSQKRMTLIK